MSYITNKAGITLDGGFKLDSAQPLDVRFVVASGENKDDLLASSCYAGMEVWDNNDNKKYRAIPSGTSFIWKEIGTVEDIPEVDLDDYVTGPNSSADTAIAVFNGTDGKTIKSTGVTINSSNVVSTAGGIKLTNGNCSLRLYNTSASPTDYSAIEVRSNSTSTNRNLFIDLANNCLVVGAASGTADTTYKMKVDGTFGVTGTATANGFIHSGLTAPTGKTRNDYVLLAGGSTKPLSEFGIGSGGSLDLGDYVKKSSFSSSVVGYLPKIKDADTVEPGYAINAGTTWSGSDSTVATTLAIDNRIKSYYWANVKISATSNTETSPTVKNLSATTVKIGNTATWQYNSSTDCVELVW